MGKIDVLCGKGSDKEYEWEQFIEIYQKLEEMSTTLTRVVLLYNIPMSTYQIDLLIITTKGIAIIELKDYLGIVHGSTERDNSRKFSDWEVVTTNGTVPLKRNAYKQIFYEKNELIELLENSSISPELKNQLRKIKGWLYFRQGSNFEQVNIHRKHKIWFDVITIDDLRRKMRYLDIGTEITDSDIDKIVQILKVGNCPSDDLRLTPAVDYDELEKMVIPLMRELVLNKVNMKKEEMKQRGELDENFAWLYNLKIYNEENRREQSIPEVIKKSEIKLIFGHSGSGKSVLMFQLCEQLLTDKDSIIPVYIKMPHFSFSHDDTGSFLHHRSQKITLINSKYLSELMINLILRDVLYEIFFDILNDEIGITSETTKRLLVKMIESNKFVWLFDGFDEMDANTQRVMIQVVKMLSEEVVQFFMTSRWSEEPYLKSFFDEIECASITLPTDRDTKHYLEFRKEFLDLNPPTDKMLQNTLSPLQLFIQSYFNFKLDDLNLYFQGLILVYGQIIWEYEHDLSRISNIASIKDLVAFLKSSTIELDENKVSLYDMIHSASLPSGYKPLLSTLGEIGYLSYNSTIETDETDKIFDLNPMIKIFVHVQPVDLTFSRIIFKINQLVDFFISFHIFEKYRSGSLIPILNTDIMQILMEILKARQPWVKKPSLEKFGTSSASVIAGYLVKDGVKLVATELLPRYSSYSTETVTRVHAGVPKWFQELVEGVIYEVSTSSGKRRDSIVNQLIPLLSRVPEQTWNQTYDIIVKDWTFDNPVDQSKEPYEYEKFIFEMFQDIDRNLPDSVLDIMNELKLSVENCPDLDQSNNSENQGDEFGELIEDSDSDGNQRELTREKEGFVVSLANQANELFNFVLDAITEVVDWIIDEVTGLFVQGQQVFNDFVEDVEEGIERGLEIIEDGFRYVWEKFIIEYIMDFKESFYEPANELIIDSNEYINENPSQIQDLIYSPLQSSSVNNTLNQFSNYMDSINSILEPIGDFTEKINDYVRTFIESIPGASFVIEAVQRIGEIAIEIVVTTIENIISGIISTLTSQYLNSILDVINGLIDSNEELLSSIDQIALSSDPFDSWTLSSDSQLPSNLDPFVFINTILNLFDGISAIGENYNQVVSSFKNSNILSYLLEFFTSGSSNVLLSPLGLQTKLITPIFSIVFAIGSLFQTDGSIDNLELIKVQAQISLDRDVNDIRNDLRFWDWMIIISAAVGETLNQITKLFTPNSFGLGLLIFFIRTGIGVFEIYSITQRRLLISEYYNEEPGGIEDWIEIDVLVNFLNIAAGLLRLVVATFFENRRFERSWNELRFRTKTYNIQISMYVIKTLIDIEYLFSEEEPPEDAAVVSGYIVSIIENILKLHENIFKRLDDELDVNPFRFTQGEENFIINQMNLIEPDSVRFRLIRLTIFVISDLAEDIILALYRDLMYEVPQYV